VAWFSGEKIQYDQSQTRAELWGLERLTMSKIVQYELDATDHARGYTVRCVTTDIPLPI
jgi:hypothetical protein